MNEYNSNQEGGRRYRQRRGMAFGYLRKSRRSRKNTRRSRKNTRRDRKRRNQTRRR